MAKLFITASLLIAGGLQALSFAPDPLPVPWLGLINILTSSFLISLVWRAPSLRSALWRAWWFSLCSFSVGLYWLTTSMHEYGHMPMGLALSALLALCSYLALYPACAAWLAYRFKPAYDQTLQAALVWAAAWTAAEWLRGFIFTGFPWLNSGYAQVDTWLGAWAAIGGAYAVTFVSALMSAILAVTLLNRKTSTLMPKPHKRLGFAFIVLLILVGGWGIRKLEWSSAAGLALHARLVQGGIDQNAKFAPGQIIEGIKQHLVLAQGPQNTPSPQVVLLPETAIPVFQHQLAPPVWDAWRQLATQQGSSILTGAPLFDPDTKRYTNSVIEIDSATASDALLRGKPLQRYDKHHLVPFGEFIPWGFRWFVEILAMPLGDFDRGAVQQSPFKVADQWIAPNICYEDIFGRELLAGISAQPTTPGATILANFSNLGWFGDSWALRQHWQMARMRAIETSRPVLRATNTGITGAIDHHGQAIATLPPMTPGFLDVTVQGQKGSTPYSKVGDALILLICIGLLLGAQARRSKQLKPTP